MCCVDSVTPWTVIPLQRMLPTQGSNPGLPHCRQILHQLSYRGRTLNFKIYVLFRIILCNTCGGCSSVAQSCLTLCDPMDYSTPGFPVLHYLPEIAQTHVRWVHDHIQSSRPLHRLLLLPSIFPSIRVFSDWILGNIELDYPTVEAEIGN